MKGENQGFREWRSHVISEHPRNGLNFLFLPGSTNVVSFHKRQTTLLSSLTVDEEIFLYVLGTTCFIVTCGGIGTIIVNVILRNISFQNAHLGLPAQLPNYISCPVCIVPLPSF
jgi:hypothetical protein